MTPPNEHPAAEQASDPTFADLFLRDREGRVALAVSVVATLAILGAAAGLYPWVVLGIVAAVAAGIGIPLAIIAGLTGIWSNT